MGAKVKNIRNVKHATIVLEHDSVTLRSWRPCVSRRPSTLGELLPPSPPAAATAGSSGSGADTDEVGLLHLLDPSAPKTKKMATLGFQ